MRIFIQASSLLALAASAVIAVSEDYASRARDAPRSSKFLGDMASQAERNIVSFVRGPAADDVHMTPDAVAKMETAVTDLVTRAEGQKTPMGTSVGQIKDLIEKTMIPKVEAAHEANKKELIRLAKEVEGCQVTKKTDDTVAEVQKNKYLKASPLHKACRMREAILATEMEDCKTEISSTKLIRDLKCRAMKNFEKNWGVQSKHKQIVEKGGGETPKIYMKRLSDTYCGSGSALSFGPAPAPAPGSSPELRGLEEMTFYEKYLGLEKECKDAEKKYKQYADGCGRKEERYNMKVAECDNLQNLMDAAACNRAVLVKDSCESYAECFTARKVSYLHTKEVVEKAVKDRKGEWRALKRMTCLIGSFKDGKVKADEISACKAKKWDTAHLDIEYPYVPELETCAVPDRYPATAIYKKLEFAPLPALAKGKMDANECYGVLEISTQPRAGSPRTCKCTRVTLNGPFSPGALVKCENCNDVFRSKDKDSCPEGTKIFSPRSRRDWQTFISSAGPLRAPNWIIDVTIPKSGCGGCKKASMNSGEDKQSAWVTKDGSPWWLRSTTYSEPSGDGEANCYMDLLKSPLSADSVTFNDNSCAYHSHSYYCQMRQISTKPKKGSPKGCHCSKVELTGRYSPGSLLKCVGCLPVRRATDKDSCPEGTKIFSPRSREDWRTVLDSTGPLRSPNWIVDVTRPTNGCGGCTRAPMNFEVPPQATWRTQDGSPWWLRSTLYNEPNGDYEADCYMDLWKNPRNADGIKFNDQGCKYFSNSYYCQPRSDPLPGGTR